MKKYAIYPGEVRAKDGDIHYISAGKLMFLYGLNPADCIVIGNDNRGLNIGNLIKLYPRNDGNYKIKEPNE